jgi:hypothetical protein
MFLKPGPSLIRSLYRWCHRIGQRRLLRAGGLAIGRFLPWYRERSRFGGAARRIDGNAGGNRLGLLVGLPAGREQKWSDNEQARGPAAKMAHRSGSPQCNQGVGCGTAQRSDPYGALPMRRVCKRHSAVILPTRCL